MEEKKKSIKETAVEIGAKIKQGASNGWNWLKDNREDITKMIPLALGLIGLVKSARPTIYERERERKTEEWYDPRTGQRWTFRRKPTNYEWAEINRRQRCGEYTEDILKDMRLF